MSTKRRFQTQYDRTPPPGIVSTEPSMTKQAFKEECNVNTILAKYKKTGMIEHLNRAQGQYGDYSQYADYQTAVNQVMAAETLFSGLPATLRSRFKNDPQEFLDYVQDPSNEKEMIELGLARAPEDAPAPLPDVKTVETSSDPKKKSAAPGAD